MNPLPLILIPSILGCSGTRDIAKATENSRTAAAHITSQAMGGGQITKEVRKEAEATEGDLRTAKDSGDVGPTALPHVESALSRQAVLIKYAGELDKVFLTIEDEAGNVVTQQAVITQALPSVTDKEPAWLQGLKKAAWIVAPVALVILLWQTGIGAIIKKFVWSLGFFIPRATVLSAKFDAETLEPGVPSPSPREAVAARRGADPAYDIAYLRAQKAIRASPSDPATPIL